MEGLLYEGRLYRDEITEHRMPAGTFFDSATLLLLTTASLSHLRRLAPGSDFRRSFPLIVYPMAYEEATERRGASSVRQDESEQQDESKHRRESMPGESP